jgi:hypothetical protein
MSNPHRVRSQVTSNGKGHFGVVNDDTADRLPPQNLEAERSVLGSILLDPSGEVLAEVERVLGVDDFYRDAHQVYYRAMLAMHEQGRPVDSVTLPDELTRRDLYGKIGGDDTLREIVDSVPHAVNARYYAAIVREKSIARSVVDLSTQLIRDAYSHQFTATQLHERARRLLDAIAADRDLAEYKPKTFGQIAKASGGLKHLWLNWLVIGNLSMVYSKPKQGKTRVYIALAKYLWYGHRWPDGAENEWPAGTKTVVLPYDRNQVEIEAEMRLAGIPDEAIVCPSDPRDPSGLTLLSLDDPLMLRLLERTLADDPTIKLAVIDTLTYASTKSLSKPEDMKALLDQVMVLAARFGVAVLILIHENRDGEALGRRINERARVIMRLERYSETDPTRLRLSVKDSNFKGKPALTVVHTDSGVVLEKDQGPAGISSDRRDACARKLMDIFCEHGDPGTEIDFGRLIDALGNAGFAGSYSQAERRWSDRDLFGRAVKAINDREDSLKDLHGWRVLRREETRAGRPKPVILYRIEETSVGE